jgi:putative CRISPR-associated protein (TIGR02619 family)
MTVCVISTVGTSVFSRFGEALRSEAVTFGRRTDVDVQQIRRGTRFEGVELYERTLNHLRAEAQSADALERIGQASAELNSLVHLLDGSGGRSDQLHFLASDTPDGVLAARVIADFASEFFHIETAQVHIIDGLQVANGRQFQQDGVRNLIGTIYDLLEKAPAGTYQRVLNPTGGFKGVVPYLTLIGMIEADTEISYIYERSPELIRLGRVPLDFNYQVVKEAYPALKAAESEFVSEAELRELLHMDDRALFSSHPAWSFFDQTLDGGAIHFSLNGLGVIALKNIGEIDRMPVYLSQQAAKRLDNAPEGSEDRRGFIKILEAIHDAGLRESNHHLYPNEANAPVYKLGRQAQRAFYDDNGERILILEFAVHINETEYDVAPRSLKNYGEYRRWEGK